MEVKQDQVQQHSIDLESNLYVICYFIFEEVKSTINHVLHDVDELQSLQSNKPFVVDKRQHMPGIEELMEYISEENFNLRRVLIKDILHIIYRSFYKRSNLHLN